MARERRLPSARSSEPAKSKEANNAVESHDHDEKSAIEKSDISHTDALSTGDETQKRDELQQDVSTEVEDTRTSQQLVKDYGNDSKRRLLLASLL